MSIDSSLKTSSSLGRHRNVLTRAERIEKLKDRKKFDPASDNPLGLPKVGNRKVVTGGKKKKADDTTEAA